MCRPLMLDHMYTILLLNNLFNNTANTLWFWFKCLQFAVIIYKSTFLNQLEWQMSDTSTCMHVPLLESLHLKCLKTPPPACTFAKIGCLLSRERILMFASLPESSNSIFRPSSNRDNLYIGVNQCTKFEVYGVQHSPVIDCTSRGRHAWYAPPSSKGKGHNNNYTLLLRFILYCSLHIQASPISSNKDGTPWNMYVSCW